MNKDILLCGVGGQGTVLASKLLASAAMRCGYVAHSAETIGMAQRGGSVTSHVRIGTAAYSPLIPKGHADMMLAFEPAEAVRNLSYMKKDGIVIVNQLPVKPVTESLRNTGYDGTEMLAYLQKKCQHLISVDAEALCRAFGTTRVFNVAILGIAVGTGALGLSAESFLEEIQTRIPEKYRIKTLSRAESRLEKIMQLNSVQMQQVNHQIQRLLQTDNYYGKKYRDLGIDGVSSQADFEQLPFSSKEDLRNAYPLGIMAAPEEEIVRIHSSSGTTGTPVIIPYTAKDVDDWAIMFARCYETAGITKKDRIQITPGYGLWTAGIGFQNGCEKLGAMAVPMGPGNTEKQIQMMIDLKTTVLTATSSYALLLAEEIQKRGLKDQICLKKGVIGSERWSSKMRKRIREGLGIELYDIYGLTEIYGPGIGINCPYETGIHYWDDYVYLEIIDPETGKVLPDGEEGEIVLTTLVKEGAPLIRFRTHDISRIIPGECPCGRKHPRIGIIQGRSDDMFKVRGVNMFPSQVEDILRTVDGASSEYSITIARDEDNNRDVMILTVEGEGRVSFDEMAKLIVEHFKSRIGMTPKVVIVPIGTLPRSEKKAKRVTDYRNA